MGRLSFKAGGSVETADMCTVKEPLENLFFISSLTLFSSGENLSEALREMSMNLWFRHFISTEKTSSPIENSALPHPVMDFAIYSPLPFNRLLKKSICVIVIVAPYCGV